ncbi:MAG: hypothetical protein RI963_1043 [Planctomycetota bacterium]
MSWRGSINRRDSRRALRAQTGDSLRPQRFASPRDRMRPTQLKSRRQDPLGAPAIKDRRWDSKVTSKLTDRTAGESFRVRANPGRDRTRPDSHHWSERSTDR